MFASTLLLSVLCVTGQVSFEAMSTKDQFLRVMQGVRSQVRDMKFIYEGSYGPTNAKGDFESTKEGFPVVFQSLYAFEKTNGFTYINKVETFSFNIKFKKNTIQVLKGEEIEELGRSTESRKLARKVRPGGPSSLNVSGSAHRFVLDWLYSELGGNEGAAYKDLGWENVGEMICKKVVLTPQPGSDPDSAVSFHLWIDLERDGNVLKSEMLYGSSLATRCRISELTRFALPSGGTTWFPLHAEVEVYRLNDPSSAMIGKEVYSMVPSSLRFNQGLSADDFDVNRRGGKIDAGPIQSRVDHELAQGPAVPVTKPMSVQALLQDRLAEAERQSEELDASAAALSSQNGISWARVCFLTLGFTLLALAIYSTWRHR